MNWDQIIGQKALVQQLKDSVEMGRISHAQLFIGQEGYGVLPLALAYAQEILLRSNPQTGDKVSHLNHLDLHFSFPVYTEKKDSLSQRFFPTFREMVLSNPYSSFDQWRAELNSENKQLAIHADEIEAILSRFSLKSFEGGAKVLIVWNAQKLNTAASNKLLKFLEEPPEKTTILLLAPSTQDLLPTILSRTQLIKVPPIDEEALRTSLGQQFSIERGPLEKIVFQAQGDWNRALELLEVDQQTVEFESLFIQWVREAFQVKTKPQMLKNIILWARKIAQWNREKQLMFLSYCSETFRLALLENYGSSNLVYSRLEQGSFQWEKFSHFIHGANIEDILEQISTADYHLTRNANAKIVWTDLGIKLSRYIHRAA